MQLRRYVDEQVVLMLEVALVYNRSPGRSLLADLGHKQQQCYGQCSQTNDLSMNITRTCY